MPDVIGKLIACVKVIAMSNVLLGKVRNFFLQAAELITYHCCYVYPFLLRDLWSVTFHRKHQIILPEVAAFENQLSTTTFLEPLTFIRSMLQNGDHGGVLYHCTVGKSASLQTRISVMVSLVSRGQIWVSLIVDNPAADSSEKEILEAYPSLSREDIRAALAFLAEITREHYIDISSDED